MGWRNNADPIIDGKLYLGNILTATNPQSLIERRITHIVSVCKDPIPADNSASGYITHRIPVEDDPLENILIHLHPACQFIHNALQNENSVVLVHCAQGLARSATVVAGYLMWSREISATEALAIVRQAREQIWPNPGQQEQLVLFELCRYKPNDAESIYRNWRMQIDRRVAQAAAGGSGQAISGRSSGRN